PADERRDGVDREQRLAFLVDGEALVHAAAIPVRQALRELGRGTRYVRPGDVRGEVERIGIDLEFDARQQALEKRRHRGRALADEQEQQGRTRFVLPAAQHRLEIPADVALHVAAAQPAAVVAAEYIVISGRDAEDALVGSQAR